MCLPNSLLNIHEVCRLFDSEQTPCEYNYSFISFSISLRSEVRDSANVKPYRHSPNLLGCTRNNSLKSRRGMKAIENKQFLRLENKFGKCLYAR